VDQRYGDTDTMTQPVNEPVTTQRYEEARAAAHRAMSSVTLIPDKPLPQASSEPERLAYRGFKIGAAFFGWLIMLSMIVLLTTSLTGIGAGASYVLDYTRADANTQAGTVAITLAAVFVLVLSLAFYIGGYVAGRLARFDGARQGFGVWMISLLLIAITVGVGAYANNKYDLVGRVDRPDVPLTNNSLITGGLITAAAVLMLPLLAALLGGKTGQRYHDKIDALMD
jgi:magnesium-transporting ATPase (P-type)